MPENLDRLWAEPTLEKVSKKQARISRRLRVWIERHVAGLVAHQVGGKGTTILAASRLVQEPPAQPRLQRMKLLPNIVPVTDGRRQHSPDNHLPAGGGALSFARFRSNCAQQLVVR